MTDRRSRDEIANLLNVRKDAVYRTLAMPRDAARNDRRRQG